MTDRKEQIEAIATELGMPPSHLLTVMRRLSSELTEEAPLIDMKVIAAHMGVSIKVATSWRDLPRDPLPVFFLGGMGYFAYPSALGAWKERNTLPAQLAAKLRADDVDRDERESQQLPLFENESTREHADVTEDLENTVE